MHAPAVRTFAVVSCVLAAMSTASAQTILSQWNWNGITAATYNVPWTGTVASGTVLGYGQGAPAAPFSTVLTSGAAADPGTVISGTTFNRSASVNPPLLTAASGAAGIAILAPTTGMNPGEAVQLSFSMTNGYRSSRYWQILVSSSWTAATGSPASGFSPVTGGIGSSVSQVVNGLTSGSFGISGTATATVSSDGIIDFRTIYGEGGPVASGTNAGNWISQSVTTSTSSISPANYANGFVDNISFTLPTGQGYENNPNFAFAIVGIFDPNNPGALSGTTGYVSSFAGTDSTDTVFGYNRSSSSGGSMRLDLVTVSAVPEPSTCALLAAGAVFSSVAWRRRRRVSRRSASVGDRAAA